MGEGSSPAPSRWFATELGTRFASALVLSLATLLVTYHGGWSFALFWLAAGVVVLVEWINTTQVDNRHLLQIALSTILVLGTLFYLAEAPSSLMVLVVVVPLAVTVLARGNRDRLWTLAGFGYATVITFVPPIIRDLPELGLTGILWMFAVTWATDIAAYFTGRHFGGPKLWPRVSPKKTWSGFVGGLLGAVIFGVVVVALAILLGWEPPINLPAVAFASGFASVASQLGDLAESALKRHFDVKDSGRLIPGHGGVMDRLDGFWAVCALVGLALLLSQWLG